MRREFLLRLMIALLAVGPSFSLLASAAQAEATAQKAKDDSVIADDEVLPWPWATQCPFPWEEIGGSWIVNSDERNGLAQDRFEITIEYVSFDGTRYFAVERFDQFGRLKARGRGFSPQSVKIIRVGMIELDERGSSRGVNYWAIVGAYQEDKTASCSADTTTVITVRKNGSASTPDDIHYIVSKAEQNGVER